MKRAVIVVSGMLVVMVLCGAVSFFLPSPTYAWGDPEIRKSGTKQQVWQGFSVIVFTKKAKGKWLGCSLRRTDDRDNEIDMEARRIPRENRADWTYTKASVLGRWEYIVKLWDRRVDDPDNPNGYHMEGELDSTGWRNVEDDLGAWM